MNLTPKTKILPLIKEHDFLLDFLSGYAPDFKKLKNPVLRNTMGRVATLEMAASMADIPLDRLMGDIAGAISEHTGQAPEVSTETAPPLDSAKVDTLKGLIQELHDGAGVEQVRARFASLVSSVSPMEISAMEQQLMAEGMPQEEVKQLCDVHVQVFKDSLEDQDELEAPAGHPVHTFMAENRALEAAAVALAAAMSAGKAAAQKEALGLLSQVNLHYLRKENQLFPLLEEKGVSGPSQVMWSIHDDARALLKEARAALGDRDGDTLTEKVTAAITMITEMIYKEEKILFPMAMGLLSDGEWARVRRGEEEIGHALGVRPGNGWEPGDDQEAAAPTAGPLSETNIASVLEALPLDTGLLPLDLINLMLKTLPLDLSLVDENDAVLYYSDSAHRIFPRSPGVIGRTVKNCHPPRSVHLVERILDAFRAGEKESADFWFEMGGRFLHIRYFALRDSAGKYRGCLEVSQDVTEIRALQGTQRLFDWD